MTRKEIIEFVTAQLLQALDGSRGIEGNKFDFKAEWYKMSEDLEQFKFLKDITAIVNSYGGGDGFMVIGFDEKAKRILDSPFKNSGWDDTSRVNDIIRKKIDRPFNVQVLEFTFEVSNSFYNISVIHIPPSLDKPHVIRNYISDNSQFPNEIFVRMGATNQRASKADLDIMYTEKNNIIVERRAVASIRVPKSHFYTTNNPGAVFGTFEITGLAFHGDLNIENLGFRPIGINQIVLYFDLRAFGTRITELRMVSTLDPSILVEPNSIQMFSIPFFEGDAIFSKTNPEEIVFSYNELLKDNRLAIFNKVELILSNGEVLNTDIRLVRV